MRQYMRQHLAILVLLFAAGAALNCARAAEHKPIWLAVARPELAEPLKALAEKRRSDGFDAIVSTKSVPDALAAVGRPDYLLLVGDDEPGQEAAAWYLPAKRMKLYRWRSEQPQEFASDAAWGDLDGKGQPSIAVGRIPARSREQVELVVRKILAFEEKRPTSADLQLPAWLGSPEYTPTINALASGLGVNMVQTQGPAWLQPWFVSGTFGDAFCGWPPDQPGYFTRQVKRGGIFGVLMGHAQAEAFFSMYFRGQPVWYTAATSAAEFNKGEPAPPMVLFSCNNGNFTAAAPCLAKSLLLMPGGPVATIAATTESHPLTNYFSGVSLLKAISGRETRLGPMWLHAQREARQARDFVMELMLKDVEGSLEAKIDVEKLRRDQEMMYALLGDPATRLRLPEPLEVNVERSASGWRWRAAKPPRATHLEVGYRSANPLAALTPTKLADAKEAGEAQEAANARFAFTAEPSPPDNGPWEGTWDRAGWLRLVATGPDGIWATVLKLE
jgi:hypothetical protein